MRRARAGAGSVVTSERPKTTREASGQGEAAAEIAAYHADAAGRRPPLADRQLGLGEQVEEARRFAGRGRDDRLREAAGDTPAQLVEKCLRPAGQVRRRRGAHADPRRAVLDRQLVDPVGSGERLDARLGRREPRLRKGEQDLVSGQCLLGVAERGEHAVDLGEDRIALADDEVAAELPGVAVLRRPTEQTLPPLRRVPLEGGLGGPAAVVVLEERGQPCALVVGASNRRSGGIATASSVVPERCVVGSNSRSASTTSTSSSTRTKRSGAPTSTT